MPASKPEQRIEEGSPLWNRRAHELALNFCPPIRPCADCGNPYINGYCCTYCGSTNPEGFTNARASNQSPAREHPAEDTQ